jgi:NAD(P)-dependent dehydrogenase (short-subunit alcohol dehydrogenase family)
MALTLDFADKHIFVFGGTTGINFGIAETFARHGAKVSVASRKQENVDTAVSSLAAAGGKVTEVVADVRDFRSGRPGVRNRLCAVRKH